MDHIPLEICALFKPLGAVIVTIFYFQALGIQLLLPPQTPVVSHRIHYICDARSVQVDDCVVAAIQREHWNGHISTRRSIDRKARDILLKSRGGLAARHTRAGAIKEGERNILSMNGWRHGKLISVGVVAESTIEVKGIASGLFSHKLNAARMMDLRERRLRDDQIDTTSLVAVACGTKGTISHVWWIERIFYVGEHSGLDSWIRSEDVLI